MFPFPLRFGFEPLFHDDRPFMKAYTCYSVSLLPGNERDDVERGGKIIMPPSALEQLAHRSASYPMLFKLINENTEKTTHCGVLEFIADENRIYIPHWMMRNLGLEEGGLVTIESVTLPVATFSKFQPKSCEFLEITNPKAVLENSLRSFACLSKGDVISIRYNDKDYELSVLETKPGDAVSIIECDMDVDFKAPDDYVPVQRETKDEPKEEMDLANLMHPSKDFVAFSGSYSRLDGKKCGETTLPKAVYKRGIPDYNYHVGTFLKFFRSSTARPDEKEDDKEQFEVFGGKGISLRQSKTVKG